MKFKLLLLGLVLACSGLFAVNEAFAQQCKAQLMSGRGGIIIDIFTGSNCSAVSNRCNSKLRNLKYREPHFYRDAYCDIINTPYPPPTPHPVPPPQSYVTRSYDRCQAPGIVRCTQEWSNGRIITEDYPCSGCRGYGNPAGDPCGWRCSFPQQ
ncbi:hypothetical protein VU11_07780 [Desulfobulbus sp. US2]|nr:hypothetical protein [Desulfobulbus sp. US4]MCW5208524.1 hypothetical protein [Desulfobulbus sp. US2]WLE96014.1 MAG: hypothetical protein QTN59_15170 [Candidatus Electrothrix communis]